MPTAFFKSVSPLPDYHLLIETATGSTIDFDLKKRLGTARFGALSDIRLFRSATTDGSFLIFGGGKVKIGASEFLDLLMVDRT